MNTKIYVIKALPCPICGSVKYTQGEHQKTLYRCAKIDKNGEQCKTVVYMCNRCNGIYPRSNFGKQGDVWVCKTCGSTQWDLTDSERMLDKIRSARDQLDVIRNKYGI